MVVGVVRRSVSSLVLVLITLVPVSGTLCAALCLPAAPSRPAGGEHQVAPSPCHETVSGQPRVYGARGHDCDCHITTAGETAATLTAATRREHGTSSLTQLPGRGSATLLPLPTIVLSASSPPGSLAFTRDPFVLRI
jgi:hypothetical protein